MDEIEEEGEEEEWSEEGWEDIDYSEFGANPYAEEEEEEIELEDYFGEEEEEGYDEDLYNLIMGGDTKIKPTIAPPTTTPGTRPWRPVPTKRPSEREKSKPIAKLGQVLEMFFSDLKSVSNTKNGQNMMKNLRNKYA
jgi:hypothetical protein